MKKLIVAVAALALMSGSAFAADWNFYGSARVSTFYDKVESIGTPGDTTSLSEGLQGNSRIGATVKVSDELTGGFEYGTTVNVRKLYGEWNFGAGKLLVGQDYTPLNLMYSNQVYGADTDMLAFGGVYSGRAPMLQLTFGDFKLAFVSPNTSITGNADGTTGAAPTTIIGATAITEVKIPAIEASYKFALDNLTFDLAGGYNSFEVAANSTSAKHDVDAYVISLGATAKVGAFYAAADIFTGQNAGNLISIETNGLKAAAFDNTGWDDGFATWDGAKIVDNDQTGYSILVGYAFNEMFTAEAGYGFVSTDSGTANTPDDEAATYYINVTVNLAPGVFFVPEFGKIDGKEIGDADYTYYGAKWQINF